MSPRHAARDRRTLTGLRLAAQGDETIAVLPSGGPEGHMMEDLLAEAAVRAVQRCAPYPFLPKDKFDSWQVVNMNFTPPSSY